jgi:serine/threonine protein kinase/WD40 repeat protein
MPALLDCPTNDALEQFLLGFGDPVAAEGLERHMAECHACAFRARKLSARDELVNAVRAASGSNDTDESASSDSLAEVFRRMAPRSGSGSDTGTWSPHSRIADAPPDLGYSTPENKLGPYLLQEVLGTGGMGRVYRGYDPVLQRAIAVKVIRRDLMNRPGIAERFLQEARAAAAVVHDHIVVVHAVEVHDGVHCLTMPLLHGRTLEARLRDLKDPLPRIEAMRLAREIATGLAAAHERGLIHRDIKPANVWLESPSDRVKILDFGLAVALESDEAGGFAGTPGYIAPELFQSRGIDARADLFSLGCVLYRAATGRAAFEGENSTATFVHTITREPEPAGAVNPKLDAEFARVIDRLLAKKPADRPATAADLLAELDAIEARRFTRRRKITRRAWLGGIVAAGGLSALAVWLARPPKAPPVRPGSLKFELSDGIDHVTFTRDDASETFDLRRDNAVSLAPGEYTLKPVAASESQRLVPATVVVEEDAERKVKLALVGEYERLTPHSQSIAGVAAIPTGERFDVLSAAEDRFLSRVKPGTQQAAKLERLDSPAKAFAATPDGRFAITAGGNKQAPFDLVATVWRVEGLRRKFALDGHRRLITAVTISADRLHAITAARDEVRLWDLRGAEPKHRPLAGHTDGHGIFAAAFDPQGKFAVTAGERGQTILWDVAKAAFVAEVNALAAGDAANAVRAVAFTGNAFYTAGDDGIIREWSGSPPKAREFPAEPKPILALAASTDGKRLLSGGEDGTIKLWRVEKATASETFTGHIGRVTGAAFSPSGREAISCGADRTVRLWRLPCD